MTDIPDKFQELCNKIGGQYNGGHKSSLTCKIRNKEQGTRKEIELNHIPDDVSEADYVASVNHRDNDGRTSGTLKGEHQNLQLSYGRSGLHHAKLEIRNTEKGQSITMTNNSERKPRPEKNWGI